ncbi:MFS transporter [Nesterenkonia sp. PF2B19]|uniref:MFS transporter n=1 Tax=Nesterenkonia sp. PF2B19 TaxID=1881858 RepID=UPI001F22B60A|nr:MFS transporter [Nesterenkonia sp. PF2B19]
MRSSLLDLTPLRDSAAFRRLWLGGTASAFAAQLAVIAVLFHVWEETGSPLATGLVGLVSAVAMTAGSLLGGTAADVHDRTRVLRWTTLGQLLAALGLTVQALPGLAPGGHSGVALVLGLVAGNAFCAGSGRPPGAACRPGSWRPPSCRRGSRCCTWGRRRRCCWARPWVGS